MGLSRARVGYSRGMNRPWLVALWLGLVGPACLGSYAKVECNEDGDCEGDEHCEDGKCEKVGGQVCANDADCYGGCKPCAEAGPCLAVVNACLANQQCVDLDVCYFDPSFCGGDLSCGEINCDPAFPSGVADYRAYLSCVFCQECVGPCGTAALCQ